MTAQQLAARLASVLFFGLAPSACLALEPDPGDAPPPVLRPDDPEAVRIAARMALQHLERVEPTLAGALVVRDVRIDGTGAALARVAQTASGIPVFGAEAVVQIDPQGQYAGQVDRFVRGVRVDTTALIDPARAVMLALQSQGMQAAPGRSATAGVAAPKVDLQILVGHGKDRLTHRVQLEDMAAGRPRRPVVFIDARTGEVAWSYDDLQTMKRRELHDLGHGTTLPGPLVRAEGGDPTADAAVNTNYDLLGWTYDCYNGLFGRDSYNAAGAGLISSVHYGTDYVNAFWNGAQMVYGDGDNVRSRSLAIAMDVTAHELTHAVTQYESGLIYAGESGGLNESMSDIFGNVCEWYRDNGGNPMGAASAKNFLVGEDVWLAAPALRYMADPAADGASLDYWTSTAGKVDVHYSSGISNLAFSLLARGGAHPRGKSRTVVTGIGMRDAAAIFYRANANYLVPSSTFADARAATLRAATDLFGAASRQAEQTGNAWTAVGVLPPSSYQVIDTRPNLSAGAPLTFSYPTSGATAMRFELSGGTGDADLYVRFGAAPTKSTWDCRPYTSANDEVCEFSPTQSGTYYVTVMPYTPFSGVMLTVRAVGWTPPPGCSGQTAPGQTAWQQYPGWPNALYLDVDTSACRFTATPRYFTSLGGAGWHWLTTGTTSIYAPTSTGFRVYLYFTYGAITPAQASSYGWYLNWQALPDALRRPELCTGATPAGSTAWQPYPGWTQALYLDVNTAACGFPSTPRYTTSLGGLSGHWLTTGATSIYTPTPTGFRVYLYFMYGSITPAQANSYGWHINWQASAESQRSAELCTGATPTGSTAWQQYSGWPSAIYLDVDTSACGFTAARYFTSLGGSTNHWFATGATSIYTPTPTGFRVYLYYMGGAMTPAIANSYGWHINWQARR